MIRHAYPRSAIASSAFQARVIELGGAVMEPTWLGNRRPHRVRCVVGHDCTPIPSNVMKGLGVCRICGGRGPGSGDLAWKVFRTRIAELDGTVIEPTWLGAGTPHRVRCVAGHDCAPRPDGLARGRGICIVCVGKDSTIAEAGFRARVAELGGTVIEPTWLGNHSKHRVRCAAGHDCMPKPSNVQSGQGICRPCTAKAWDAFYVVTGPVRLKFGVTSGDPRPRLRTHARAGYVTVLRLFTGLPGITAPTLEHGVMAALAMAGERPIRGREYFDISVQALVLDVVDGHVGALALAA